MALSNLTLDREVQGSRSTDRSSSGGPGIPDPDSTASFYHADLDKVQRKLSGVHVQMYVRSRCLEDVLSQSLYNQVRRMYSTYLVFRERRCMVRIRLLASLGRAFFWAWASSSQQRGHWVYFWSSYSWGVSLSRSYFLGSFIRALTLMVLCL